MCGTGQGTVARWGGKKKVYGAGGKKFKSKRIYIVLPACRRLELNVNGSPENSGFYQDRNTALGLNSRARGGSPPKKRGCPRSVAQRRGVRKSASSTLPGGYPQNRP